MNYLDVVLPQLESIGLWAYWIVLLVSLAESLAFVGLVVPGSTIIVFAGFIASRGVLDIGDLIWFVAIGAILGDSISFYLGKKGVTFLQKHDIIFKDEHMAKAEAFFKTYGDRSIFLGRFIGPIRPVIPFVAGMSRMNTKRFLFWNIISAFCFAVIFLASGYFMGGACYVVRQWFSIGEYAIITAVTVIVVFLFWPRFISKAKI